MFQTKRWNEAIGMADLKAQSPSLAITMRALFGQTTSRRLRFKARRMGPLRSDFEVGGGGDPSPDSRRGAEHLSSDLRVHFSTGSP